MRYDELVLSNDMRELESLYGAIGYSYPKVFNWFQKRLLSSGSKLFRLKDIILLKFAGFSNKYFHIKLSTGYSL